MTGTGGDKDRGRLPRFIVILVRRVVGLGTVGLGAEVGAVDVGVPLDELRRRGKGPNF